MTPSALAGSIPLTADSFSPAFSDSTSSRNYNLHTVRAVCFSCRTLAHPGLDCKANLTRTSQRAERTLLSLAKTQRWRQCPQCR